MGELSGSAVVSFPFPFFLGHKDHLVPARQTDDLKPDKDEISGKTSFII